MRRVLSSSLFALSLAVAAPAMAGSSNFESTISAPALTNVKIEVVLGEDLAYRADNLPKKLSDRSSSRGLNNGFSGNGFYGERELNRLTERLESKLERKLTKQGVTVSDTASTVLRVTLVNAKPNRPTFGQLSKQPSLSFQSFGVGGAEIESELIAAGGQSLGSMNYKWYETDIRFAARTAGTWTDAYRAMDRYARKATKTLQPPVS